MTAPCGLDCFNCPIYLAQDNPGLRKKVAQNLGIVVLGLVAIRLVGAADRDRTATYARAHSARGEPPQTRTQLSECYRLRPLLFALAMAGVGATAVLVGRWLWLPGR